MVYDCWRMAAVGNLEALKGLIALGDGQAYKELFVLYYPRLLQFSYSFTHCKESAEEIVSDVFLNIWQKRKSLSEVENLHLYLYISTKNLSLNSVLKEKRNKTFSLEEVQVEFNSIYVNPEQLCISGEMFQRIQSAIRQLPPKCQLIFKLIKEDGLKYKQVADLLGLSIKTVECQMSIALRKMSLGVQFDLARVSPH